MKEFFNFEKILDDDEDEDEDEDDDDDDDDDGFID